MKVYHELEPFFDENSEILILGSIPSIKSRETGFYYAHKQNRFWQVLADVYKENTPLTIADKKMFLKKHHIALWDTIKECDITGSSDSSIKNVIVNDINFLLTKTKIKKIFVAGRISEKYYNKFCLKDTNIPCIYLPSTSGANASMNYEKLLASYQIILNYRRRL